MFTTQFKVSIATALAVVAIGGLAANQVQLNKKVNSLSNNPLPTVTVVASPTVEPTATPTATLKFVPSKSLLKPVVTGVVK